METHCKFNHIINPSAHPLKANTVPTSVLLSVGILGPIFLILIIDLAVIKKSRGETGQTIQNFTFGFFVNLLFTEMTKYTIGRLRYLLINYTREENY